MMVDTQQANTSESTPESGFIPRGIYYYFFVGGVLIGGVIVVPIGTTMVIESISPLVAWVGGIVSAIVFLCCFDRRGNWRWVTAVPAIAIASIGASVYHQSSGQPVAVVGGVLGFLIYMVFGYLGIGICKLMLNSASASSPTKKQ